MKYYFVLLLTLIFYSFSSYATESYDYYVQCESCTYSQMEHKAKEAAKTIGRQDVVVFSTETSVIKAFNIDVEIESEPGYQYVEKYSYVKSVSAETQNQFNEVSSTLREIRAGNSVDYTGPNCPTSECLTTVAGMGSVTSWLTGKFVFPATMNSVMQKILSKITGTPPEKYKISVCFDDGICVEFQFEYLFSSFGWKTTGVTSASGPSGGTGSPTGGQGSGGGGYIVCDTWVTYTNTTADGT